MPIAEIAGIKTHYQVSGEGPPLLLLAPMGFNPSISQRRLNRIWRGFQPLDVLPRDFKVIVYDRRESGNSGGRVEPLSWPLFARHARGLLDHLEIDTAFMLGACIGCSVALALGAQFRERCRALLLHWPTGGFRWLNQGRANFDLHIAFVREHGLPAVVERARQAELFWSAPEAGPWAAVIASDEAFAESYVDQDLDRYWEVLAQSRDSLFADTMPSGASGEELMAMDVPAFIMPGDDAIHTTSCAHTLRELLPQGNVSSLTPRQQNAASIANWVYASTALGAGRRSMAA